MSAIFNPECASVYQKKEIENFLSHGVDSIVYLWNYSQQNGSFHTVSKYHGAWSGYLFEPEARNW